jgi:hypothetical protein
MLLFLRFLAPVALEGARNSSWCGQAPWSYHPEGGNLSGSCPGGVPPLGQWFLAKGEMLGDVYFVVLCLHMHRAHHVQNKRGARATCHTCALWVARAAGKVSRHLDAYAHR